MTIETVGGPQPGRNNPPQQSASAVLMIRPAAFGYNPQTATTNRMQRPGEPAQPAQAQARSELDHFTQALRRGSPFSIRLRCILAVSANGFSSFHQKLKFR